MIHLTIDGISVEVEKGTTILAAAEQVGIKIPTLCYLKDLLPDGSCRICVVEITSNGKTWIDTACTAQCYEGMEVRTNCESVVDSRKKTLDLLLSEHRVHCLSCEANSDCKLQDLCVEYGVEKTSYTSSQEEKPIDDSNKFFTYDPSLCILCHRCVNTCNEIVGRGAIDTMNRGFESVIGAPFDDNWNTSTCESCGNCVAACPTGALSMKRRKKYRKYQVEKKVLTTCPHCATGCQYYLLVKDGKIVNATEPVISAQCLRVSAADGHMAAVSVSFDKKPSKEEILKRWAEFKGLPQQLELPSAPKPFLQYFEDPARPQTRLDRDFQNGFGVSIGRLREDKIFDYRFVCLSHNTVRGAAGGAVLNAELLYKLGYFD